MLGLVAERRLIALATPALFLEYEEVLKRPEQLAATGLAVADIDRALSGLASIIEPVTIRFGWRPQLDDAGDEMVLETAINGRADSIVTFNRRDFARRRAALRNRPGRAGRNTQEYRMSNRAAYPLKLPVSVKRAATRLAREDGVSLNQWISAAVAQKVGAVEEAALFFARRADGATGNDLMAVLAMAPDAPPATGDALR